MKKFLVLMLVLILTNVGVVQAERDDNFHKKYKLESVLVFSRHNIQIPVNCHCVAVNVKQSWGNISSSGLWQKI